MCIAAVSRVWLEKGLGLVMDGRSVSPTMYMVNPKPTVTVLGAIMAGGGRGGVGGPRTEISVGVEGTLESSLLPSTRGDTAGRRHL